VINQQLIPILAELVLVLEIQVAVLAQNQLMELLNRQAALKVSLAALLQIKQDQMDNMTAMI